MFMSVSGTNCWRSSIVTPVLHAPPNTVDDRMRGVVASARRDRSRRALIDQLQHGGATRGQLAVNTGLSRSAVAAGVAQLIAAGVAVEEHTDARVSPGRGRRSSVVRLTPPRGHVIGIDFGHMHVRVAVADTQATIFAEDMTILDVDNLADDALARVEQMVRDVLREARVDRDEVSAIAAGIPGPLDLGRRTVSSPTILHSWTTLDVAAELSDRLGGKVHVGNDADMGAIGEHRFGVALGLTDFIYIKASHGIGASAVLNGRCYRGSSGLAGEIGHTSLTGYTQRCRCGKQGCLEAVVSVPEVRAQLANTHLHYDPHTDAPSLTAVAEDPVGARVLNDAGRMVGTVVATGCNWLNPQAIVLGGELGVAGDAFADGVRESLTRYAQPASANDVNVHRAALGSRSELMGALAVAVDHCLSR